MTRGLPKGGLWRSAAQKDAKRREKQCQSWLVTENLKIEHWPAECRIADALHSRQGPQVWPIKIKLNKRVVVGQ